MSDSAALKAWRRRALGAGVRRRPPATAALLTAAAVLVCCVLGGRVLSGEKSAAQTPPATVSEARCPTVATELHADIDGDGCDDPISFADGVLTAGSTRLQVGAPGDQIAIGRWTCGRRTVTLLRPTTGEVFRFDGWATPGASVPAVALGRVEGAVALRAAARSSRCDDIEVTRVSGPPVLLPERPVAG